MFWKWQYVGRNADYIDRYTEHDHFLSLLIAHGLGCVNRNSISDDLISAIKASFIAVNTNSLACEIFENLVTAYQKFLDHVLQCVMKNELLSILEVSGPVIQSLDDNNKYKYSFERDGRCRLKEIFMNLANTKREDDRYAFERFGYIIRDVAELSCSDLICSELANNSFSIPTSDSAKYVRAYCPQDNLGTSFEHDGEIVVPYEIRMSHSLEHTLAEVEYLYNSFSESGKNSPVVPLQLIKKYHGLGFAINHNPRAVGLWLWNYIQIRYGRHVDLPHGAKSEARKALKSRFDVGKLGYSDSEPRVFDRLYARTNECIQKSEVLPMK